MKPEDMKIKSVPAARTGKFWHALLLAMLMHLLLLVLFRTSPVQSELTQGDLPRVGRIELNDPANRALAEWLQHHDPALLLAPGKNNSFSKIMEHKMPRNTVEDLPSLPHLSTPRRTEVKNEKIKFAPVKVNLLPEQTFHLQSHLQNSKSPAGVVISVNRQPLAGGSRYLSEAFVLLKTLPAAEKSNLVSTVISVAPPRIAGMEHRMNIAQSSGNSRLDKIALQNAANYLARAAVGNVYKITFNWHNMPADNSKESGK